MELLILLIGYLLLRKQERNDIPLSYIPLIYIPLSYIPLSYIPLKRGVGGLGVGGFEGKMLGKISYEELKTDIARVLSFGATIISESIAHGINPCIIMGIIHRESQGNHSLIVGKPSTYGLMQLQERTARAHGLKGSVSNLLNPGVNIKIGIAYFGAHVKRYRDPLKAISAYNAGHATTKNAQYVKDVTELSNIYCSLSPSLIPQLFRTPWIKTGT